MDYLPLSDRLGSSSSSSSSSEEGVGPTPLAQVDLMNRSKLPTIIENIPTYPLSHVEVPFELLQYTSHSEWIKFACSVAFRTQRLLYYRSKQLILLYMSVIVFFGGLMTLIKINSGSFTTQGMLMAMFAIALLGFFFVFKYFPRTQDAKVDDMLTEYISDKQPLSRLGLHLEYMKGPKSEGLYDATRFIRFFRRKDHQQPCKVVSIDHGDEYSDIT
jgi:hypothetical protein